MPLLAMLFTDEVRRDGADFLVARALLATALARALVAAIALIAGLGAPWARC